MKYRDNKGRYTKAPIYIEYTRVTIRRTLLVALSFSTGMSLADVLRPATSEMFLLALGLGFLVSLYGWSDLLNYAFKAKR